MFKPRLLFACPGGGCGGGGAKAKARAVAAGPAPLGAEGMTRIKYVGPSVGSSEYRGWFTQTIPYVFGRNKAIGFVDNRDLNNPNYESTKRNPGFLQIMENHKPAFELAPIEGEAPPAPAESQPQPDSPAPESEAPAVEAQAPEATAAPEGEAKPETDATPTDETPAPGAKRSKAQRKAAP